LNRQDAKGTKREPDKATNLPLGLLINFNVPVLKDGIERVVLT